MAVKRKGRSPEKAGKKAPARGKAKARKPVAPKSARKKVRARKAPGATTRIGRERAAKRLKTLETALRQSNRPLTEWVDLLDRVGGPELGHGTLVRILSETQGLAPWPANCIVLNYRGLYGFGEHSDLMEHQDQLNRLGKWK